MGRSINGALWAAPECDGISRFAARRLSVVDRGAARQHLPGIVLGLACLGALAGCGGKKADSDLVPVKGEFFFDSQPAQGALVILHPSAGPDAATWPHGLPHGVVDTAGAYNIGLPPLGEGAPAGDYKVLLTWNLPIPGADPTDSEPETFDKLGGRWATPEKSTLSATVAPPSTEIPRFDLKSK